MSLASYIVNWEELIPMLQDLLENLTARGIKDVNGTQKIKGFAESIPAIQATYKVVDWTLSTNIVMTAVTVNQSSWVGSDYWELWIDGELIFETVFTKELGEQKHWEVVHPVAMGQNIKIILHNNTGNSRDIWSDIEYLEVGEFEVVEPEEPEEPEDGELIPDPDPPVDPEEPEPEPEEPIEPEEPEPAHSARVRVRYLKKNTLVSIKAQRVYLNQSGILNYTGDEIEGWKLLDPKNKTIEIVDSGDYVVDFLYLEELPLEPDYSSNVRVRYVDKDTGDSIIADKIYSNQAGTLTYAGDVIDGWELLHPKKRTIEITNNDEHVVTFLYVKEGLPYCNTLQKLRVSIEPYDHPAGVTEVVEIGIGKMNNSTIEFETKHYRGALRVKKEQQFIFIESMNMGRLDETLHKELCVVKAELIFQNSSGNPVIEKPIVPLHAITPPNMVIESKITLVSYNSPQHNICRL